MRFYVGAYSFCTPIIPSLKLNIWGTVKVLSCTIWEPKLGRNYLSTESRDFSREECIYLLQCIYRLFLFLSTCIYIYISFNIDLHLQLPIIDVWSMLFTYVVSWELLLQLEFGWSFFGTWELKKHGEWAAPTLIHLPFARKLVHQRLKWKHPPKTWGDEFSVPLSTKESNYFLFILKVRVPYLLLSTDMVRHGYIQAMSMLSRFPFHLVCQKTYCHHILSCLFYPFAYLEFERTCHICPRQNRTQQRANEKRCLCLFVAARMALMWQSRWKSWGTWWLLQESFLWIQMPFDLQVI